MNYQQLKEIWENHRDHSGFYVGALSNLCISKCEHTLLITIALEMLHRYQCKYCKEQWTDYVKNKNLPSALNTAPMRKKFDVCLGYETLQAVWLWGYLPVSLVRHSPRTNKAVQRSLTNIFFLLSLNWRIFAFCMCL